MLNSLVVGARQSFQFVRQNRDYGNAKKILGNAKKVYMSDPIFKSRIVSSQSGFSS